MSDNISSLSLLYGPSEPSLKSYSIGQLLNQQAVHCPTKEAVIFPAEGVRYTYQELDLRVRTLSRALIAHGIKSGDRIGVFCGNCVGYVEVFLAATRIGAITVLLNNAYSTTECFNVLRTTGCSLLFTATHIGQRDLASCLRILKASLDGDELPDLKQIVLMKVGDNILEQFQYFESFLDQSSTVPDSTLCGIEQKVQADQTCTFQFTSGTTGIPKIAMLTHKNVISNALSIGHRLLLSEKDIVCCPYPLFHISGLVIGLLSCLAYGAAIVYPSTTFDPSAVLHEVVREKCTGLHGVPTIFIALLERHQQLKTGPIHLRTGLIGGAPIPAALLKEMHKEFGFEDLTVAYGMTETSPISFMSRSADQPSDAVVHRDMLPHTFAKIIDSAGNIVSRGIRGELCIAGPGVQKGYYQNPDKTLDALKTDSCGVVWMHTGDEAVLDAQGHCIITGRIKDIIIRGAENIYPAEIEEHLNKHHAISQSCVVGVKHKTLGEEVAAFIQSTPGQPRPSGSEIIEWLQISLGAQKAPTWIFWLGDGDVPVVFPITDSGKIRRNEMADVGNKLVGKYRESTKLDDLSSIHNGPFPSNSCPFNSKETKLETLSSKTPLESILNTYDFEKVASQELSRKTWAFYSSAATDMITRDANKAMYDRILLRPRVLRNVNKVNTRTTILGCETGLPLFVSPAAWRRWCIRRVNWRSQGVVRNMALANISTNASYTASDITACAPGHPFFFQLYINRDRAASEQLLRQVEKSGIKAVFLTVDAPVAGKREADERVGADASEIIYTAPMTGAQGVGDAKGSALGRTMGRYIDASFTWEDLKWLRRSTSLPIVLKGIQTAEDALMAMEYGVDGIVVSNHGGRSVDTSTSSIAVLMEIRQCCPQVFEHLEVFVDGGIRRGTDIFKAICLGAKAVGMGRQFLYSLTYGQEGVERLIEIMKDELETTMKLLGITDLSQAHPGLLNTLDVDHLIPKRLGESYSGPVVKAKL
ncbi:long-chain-fatty-acid-CoA ligase [Aspergillus bombycis]|uniref:L-lactate dehydrogenase (cytochrome) n=1 Tax=Aspergillus bombycis TaxID=109264 RepID=A0A1F7ZQB0_9EURO|nr:long-chain-fatty-acid-CoA ligase [Aspergillus bombycis]OGM41640.1 long-chain-fatty-acid-CoA ligase [Aspergillus bombycis]